MDEKEHFVIGYKPEPVLWRLMINDQFGVEMTSKNHPNFFHRFMMKLLLGWKVEVLRNDRV